MRRLLRVVWAGSWLIVFLLGAPYVLIRWVGWRWPLAPSWQQLLDHPATTALLIDLAIAVVWALWLILLYALVADVLHRLRRTRLRLPTLPTPLQTTASTMLGATVFTLSAPPLPASPPPVTPISATIDQPTTTPAAPAVPVEAGRTTSVAPTAMQQHQGLTLPDGGWVDWHTGAAVAQAAATVWVGRRRRYIPRSPAETSLEDLTPLPATVTAIQTILTTAPDSDEPSPPAEPAVALVGPADLPITAVGLTGPGTADGLRGLIVVTLYTASPPAQPPAESDQPRVVLTTAMAHALRISHTAGGIHQARTTNDALTTLETLAVQRHKAAGPPSAQGPVRHGIAPPADNDGLILGVLDPPQDPGTAQRVTVLAALGAVTNIRILIHGTWPGPTWTINPDGNATTDNRAVGRLCRLPEAAANDLLNILDPTLTTTTRRVEVGNRAVGVPRPINHRPAPPDNTTPRLQLLGTVTLWGGTGPVHFSRTTALPVLTYLALYPDAATAEHLCRALWPQLPTHATTNRLYNTITSIRNATTPLDATLISHDGTRYRLNRDHLTVDLWQLHDAGLHAATTPADDQPAAWQHITNLYTGTLADGWTYGWLDPHRETARRLALDAYTALANHQPLPDHAAALIRAALRVDPVNNHLHAQANTAQVNTAPEPSTPGERTARHDVRPID